MGLNSGVYASQLRRELGLRNRRYARGRLHVESYGGQPVIVYAPDGGRHGNFFDPAYAAIAARPEWIRRFNKVHAQGTRALPKPLGDPARRWRELDSSMSSDALLMNVFCAPGVVECNAVRNTLGLESGATPEFGWKARVPLKSGLMDRTEVDMRLGSLLVEAKLTESDFQIRTASAVEAYRDFAAVFEPKLLQRVEIPLGRWKEAVEFPEDYSQENESAGDESPALIDGLEDFPSAGKAPTVSAASANQAPEVLFVNRSVPRAAEVGYASYQLIRNVLAAYAQGCSFCVVHDERRPDLREVWFQVMAAVKSAELRVRLKVLTWQELAALVPDKLQEFLDCKYGIVAPGRIASRFEVDDGC